MAKRLLVQVLLAAMLLSALPTQVTHAASNRGKLTLDIEALQDEVSPGTIVTYRITVKNKAKKKQTFDVEAQLHADLKFVKAPGADHDDEEVEWENITLKAGKKKTLFVVASVRQSAQAGDTLDVVASVDGDDEEEASVRVRGNNSHQYQLDDPILRWNEIALHCNYEDFSGTFRSTPEQPGPTKSAYALGLVHAAMFEAENSIDRTYQPYLSYVTVLGNTKPSIDAAVAAAAYSTLIAMHPAQRSILDAKYQQHLAEIPDSAAKNLGISIGFAAASQVMAAREGDGYATMNTWMPSQQPGRHRVDPLNPGQPFHGSDWGAVRPFILQSGSQFRAPPPPAIDSAEYAAAYNEVKIYGGDGITTPTVRTQEQTEIGLYWAYDGTRRMGTPPRLYNQIIRVIAQQRGNTVAQNARLFALVNMAMSDAGVTAWESKYYYDYWRPIVGIREADVGTGPTGLGDNNPATAGDAAWKPLGAPNSNGGEMSFTPPFPAYPSGHATFGAAAFKMVANFYGTDNIAFVFMSDELNGATTDERGNVRPARTRSFSTLSQAIRENGQSRIYLGVHWQFDATAGIDMGTKIADYIYAIDLQPVR